MKQFETSKGIWQVVEINSTAEGQFYVDTLSSYHYKLSEITEEQAGEIVDNSMMNTLCYENYINEGFKGRTWFNSSIQSLHSLLKQKGIQTTNNTYIFKV